MGVGEDFATFKDRYNISADLISSISYRYRRITRQLNTDFWNTSSDTAHSLYIGSYGRDTAAKGISDLDIAFELPNAEYHKYNRHQSNGQSALLQAVKRSMQNTYSTSDTSGDGQVVVISFDDKIKFEVLPVFQNENSDSFTYPLGTRIAVRISCGRKSFSRCRSRSGGTQKSSSDNLRVPPFASVNSTAASRATTTRTVADVDG